jgi:hypothetical protein
VVGEYFGSPGSRSNRRSKAGPIHGTSPQEGLQTAPDQQTLLAVMSEPRKLHDLAP